MLRLFSVAAVIIGIGFAGIAGAQAMPAASLDHAQAGMTIPVAGGCGAGWHRGPYGGCRRNGYYGGVYYGGGPVVVAPAPPFAFRKVKMRALSALRCARLNEAVKRIKASLSAS